MFDISRPTAYKFIHRYETAGLSGLLELSRRPRTNPNQTPDRIEEEILRLRNRHPRWGAPKLAVLLEDRFPGITVPAVSTISAILKRNGMVKERRRRKRVEPVHPIFDPLAPNEVWSADFKGKFRMGNKVYCYPLTIADSYSRYVFAAKGMHHANTKNSDISRLIYDLIGEFYEEAAGRSLLSGMVIAHQTFGDMLRWNPHFHAIVLEGGFDDEGTFFYIPFTGLDSMAEVFRRRVIKLLVERELLNENFAQNLLSWRHSGFSIDNSVRILDESAQENLAEYIARPPISLAKIRYEPFKGRVLFHTTYSEYFKENLHMFDALDFIAELTQHIPPKGLQLIRRYGLYASRTKGRWENMPWVSERAPEGWKNSHPNAVTSEGQKCTSFSEDEVEVDILAYKRAWARLLSKVYEIDPLVCPKCGAEMKVIAVIENPR
jgi:transposase